MTFLQARTLIRSYGCTIGRKNSAGEYRVNVNGGSEITAYYTDDLDDAVHTAYQMSQNRMFAYERSFAEA
jgi:hypothetical protein